MTMIDRKKRIKLPFSSRNPLLLHHPLAVVDRPPSKQDLDLDLDLVPFAEVLEVLLLHLLEATEALPLPPFLVVVELRLVSLALLLPLPLLLRVVEEEDRAAVPQEELLEARLLVPREAERPEEVDLDLDLELELEEEPEDRLVLLLSEDRQQFQEEVLHSHNHSNHNHNPALQLHPRSIGLLLRVDANATIPTHAPSIQPCRISTIFSTGRTSKRRLLGCSASPTHKTTHNTHASRKKRIDLTG